MVNETAHGASGGGEAAMTHGGHEEPHASNRTYIVIALVLGVLTALEVMIFYVEALAPVLVPILLLLSGAKFALVVAFYMHLKYDPDVLRGLFFGPLLIAVAIIVAMMALYGYFL